MIWMQDKNDKWTKNQQISLTRIQPHELGQLATPQQWNVMKALAFEFLFNAQLGPVNLQ